MGNEKPSVRLSGFILANIEPILGDWEDFARSVWPGKATDPATLRDHAEDILRALVRDMRGEQTDAEQSDKSKGEGPDGTASSAVDQASHKHGADRVASKFDLSELVSEYRALRASVLRLWRESDPHPDPKDLDDLTRFNESIDQSLTEAVVGFTRKVELERQAAIDVQARQTELLHDQNEKLRAAAARQHKLIKDADRAAIALREARDQANTANRAKDLFLATLSHEMRTPLNAIVGWLRILRRDRCSEEDRREALNVIERSTQAQVKLIEDVLDVSRIVSGKLQLEIRPCDLIEVINAGVDVVRPAADARDITLDVQLDPAASRSTCDGSRIQQVVWNLVSNAVKFTPKGGTIRVTLSRENSSSQIQVSDTGQGISPELLSFVFDRFRQADSSSRRRFSGLGLGLSIVKHIIEMHGGTVEVDSAGEGRGATFTVHLPIKAVQISKGDPEWNVSETEGEGDNQATPSLPPVRLDGLRVLVVDDDPDARQMLVKVLEGVGAVVKAAGSADDALEVLAETTRANGRMEVLVSDIGMPDQDGYELIREVRRRGHNAKDFPAVALTAYAHSDDARVAISAGFQVHLPKPVELHNLTAAIARLTGRVA